MAVPAKHLLAQGRVLATLGRTVVTGLRQRGREAALPMPAMPGPELHDEVPPPSLALVRDYVRNAGGDPAAYRSTLPPHLFPQWAFPLAARTLDGVPYPILKVVNGGCRLQMNAPLPLGVPLRLRARLEAIEDNGRRAILRQRIVTGTADLPDALVADLHLIVPTPLAPAARNGHENGKPAARPAAKDAPLVPSDARELAFHRLPSDAGLAFAFLTGDFNPLHWLSPYARAAGFKAAILHGFATLARTMEGLHRGRFAGAVDRLASIDVRFTRPLTLPARVGLYVVGNAVFVGDAPGGPAYMTGQFTERTAS